MHPAGSTLEGALICIDANVVSDGPLKYASRKASISLGNKFLRALKWVRREARDCSVAHYLCASAQCQGEAWGTLRNSENSSATDSDRRMAGLAILMASAARFEAQLPRPGRQDHADRGKAPAPAGLQNGNFENWIMTSAFVNLKSECTSRITNE